ncbi:hypothetical protein H2277_02275 [Campylobacter sp. W0014]|uniref:hypothetical protein n=1 Tax=Campylobacter sp. W0014 TaxID=2735781 RepID=UPI001ED697CA|nr:hypothetical protein [Campylobacter sp. W0014]
MRSTTRNKSIDEFVKEKFKSLKTNDKRYPFKVRYINLKPRNKSLSNTMIILNHSKDCFELSKKNKKSKDFYIEVQFNGLYQPSKQIESEVWKILSKMIKRFKAYSVDIACDFDDNLAVSKAREYEHANRFKKLKIDGEIHAYKTSIYVNSPKSKYYNLKRVLIYDKYEKQTYYHKEKLKPEFTRWKRLELRFRLKNKFLDCIESDVNEAFDFMQDYLRMIGIWHFNIEVILEQTKYLNNPRWAKVFKPYALAS